VVQVHREIDKLHAAGAEVIVIGNGAPHFIAGFRELTGWQGPIYTDPSLGVFEAAQLERGIGRTLDPRGLFKTARALAGGHRQGRTQGDAWQQGGVLVVAPGGEIRWRHASARPGDNASVDEILASLRD
jgi:hypothetical protein